MNSRASTWRLLDTGARTGAANMAIDAAIQQLHSAGKVPPTLRFYDWEPPAVSIGRMQRPETGVHVDKCLAADIDVVRRPTGGRAVLHKGDFTFSLIATAGDVIPPTVKESYALMCRVACRALAELGLAATVGCSGRDAPTRHACFSSSTLADLVLDGRKIVGAAQAWDGLVLLQQNSILVSADPGETLSHVRLGGGQGLHEAIRELRMKTCSLVEVLGFEPAQADLAAAVISGVSEILDVECVHGSLTPQENALARDLQASFIVACETCYQQGSGAAVRIGRA